MNKPPSAPFRLETAILGRSDLDVTERRRRIFLTLAVAVAVPFIIAMDLANFHLLNTFEIAVDSLALVLLVVNLVLIRFMPTGEWLYRADALFFGFLLLYYLTEDLGNGTAVMWSFACPLAFMFLLGRREGAIWTGIFFVGTALMLQFSPTNFSGGFSFGFLSTYLMIAVLAYIIEGLRERFEAESRALIEQLETALSEVKTLKGLLPICASCKKVRDDTGYWNQIESYLHDHADASFTHSVCPDCLEELYPEFVEQYMKPSRQPDRDDEE
jgi:hypothetical protein